MTLEPTNMIYMVTASQAGNPLIYYCVGEDAAMKRQDVMIARGYAPRVYVECRLMPLRPTHIRHELPPESSTEPYPLPTIDNAAKPPSSPAHRRPLEALESLRVDENGLIHT